MQGVNIMQFCKEYNARTQDKPGQIIPVEITVFEVRRLGNALGSGRVLHPGIVLRAAARGLSLCGFPARREA